MGKSYLLKWLAKASTYAHCTARQLINRHNPRSLLGDATTLLVDALDEVSTQQGGDALDQVLCKLGELGYPNFVLSCRVADWRSATGIEAINEQYTDSPLELHLDPFNDSDANDFLASRLGFDAAKTAMEHFNTRGLHGLLGNPQTLELISNVANKGPLPETRSELFASAIDILRVEHKDGKATCQPEKEAGLDAAGAAFAGLILTGSEALVRKAAANVAEGELLLADIAALPGGDEIAAMLTTRLFKSDGTDRFNYWHRRIGEFSAARWLAKTANTKRKRRRLLALFQSEGMVPANLRGVHAWLAREPSLALQVIAADPMGIIEYGDADDLSLEQARALINALRQLAANNPNFRDWGPYSVRGITQPALLCEVRELITHCDTPFGLRLLILEAIKGTKIGANLKTELRTLILDDLAIFANRSAAAEALVNLMEYEDWASILRTLHRYDSVLSIRLAIEISNIVDYANFDDELIVDLVTSHAKINNHTIGVLTHMQRYLPESRIEGILSRLASVEATLKTSPRHITAANKDGYLRASDTADFAYHLIMRRISAGPVTANELWSWLEHFDSRKGYQRESRQKLDEFILNNNSLRREVQRFVILERDNEDSISTRGGYLRHRSLALALTPEDILYLLKALDPTDREDERWRDVIKLINYQDETGAAVRQAATSFAMHRPDLLIWLNRSKQDKILKWQFKNKKLEKRQRAKRAVKYNEQRQRFKPQINRMRLGESDSLIELANIYLNKHGDFDRDYQDHERIAYCLGNEIADASHNGFDTFLTTVRSMPTSQETIDIPPINWYCETACIIVVALAERFRKNIGFDDIPNESLVTGFLELRQNRVEDEARMTGIGKVIERTLLERGIWGSTMRLYYDPQFKAQLSYIDGLNALMHDDENSVIVCELAGDWLTDFPNIFHAPEIEIIIRLLRSGQFDNLHRARELFLERDNDERRRNWDSVGVLIDFERTVAWLEASSTEAELLWNLMRIINESTTGDTNIVLSSSQIEWIIKKFRPLWPQTHAQTGVFVGNRNDWNASQHITKLILRLGNDVSTEASASLQRLRNGPDDGYTETIKSVASEQARIRVEVAYTAPTLDAIKAIVLDRAPSNAADLQSFMIEELSVVQAKIKSDDAESWRGFYNNDTACDEERCRDHLLGLLRQGSEGIVLEPETHIAADKEVDITCSVGSIRIPIEIKGQWHPQLWQGADAQLDALYTQDWRANGHGIYLVLWFGEGQPANKLLKNPGHSRERPQSPEELRQMLTTSSRAASEGRVIVVVLDLRRP